MFWLQGEIWQVESYVGDSRGKSDDTGGLLQHLSQLYHLHRTL